MSNLLFSNSVLLGGLLALAIPIIIHLFFRKKKEPLRFSTIQFFVKQDESLLRKNRLKHWLLLCTRLLLIAILVLAFARPYLNESSTEGNSESGRRMVIVLDRSASIQAEGRWLHALKQIQQSLQVLSPADQAAIVDASLPVKLLFPFQNASSLWTEASKLTPSASRGDLAAAIKMAVNLIADRGFEGSPALHVISDLQKSSAEQVSGLLVPTGIDLKVCALDAPSMPNVSLTDLRSTRATEVEISASSDSGKLTPSTHLDLLVDGKPVAAQPIELTSINSTNITIGLPALDPGWHSLEARLTTQDTLGADNIRYGTLFVPPPVKILLVEPTPSKRLFLESSFFAWAALHSDEKAPLFGRQFHCQKAEPSDLETILQAASGSSAPDVVILPALPSIAQNTADALRKFVSRAGGLILFLGEEASAVRYNTQLGSLLPADIGNKNGSLRLDTEFWMIGQFKTNSPVFGAFREFGRDGLTLPKFWRRHTLHSHGEAAILAQFDDNSPFIVAKNLDKGRIVLVNTSANTAWTDWPKRKSFVPWVHGLVHHAADLEDEYWTSSQTSLAAGETWEITFKELGSSHVKLRGITQQSERELKVNSGHAETQIASPGIFSVMDSAGSELRRIAVNIPKSEGTMNSWAAEQFLSQLLRVGTEEWVANALRNEPAPKDDQQRHFWRILLIAGVLLFLMEPLLANRTFA